MMTHVQDATSFMEVHLGRMGSVNATHLCSLIWMEITALSSLTLSPRHSIGVVSLRKTDVSNET